MTKRSGRVLVLPCILAIAMLSGCAPTLPAPVPDAHPANNGSMTSPSPVGSSIDTAHLITTPSPTPPPPSPTPPPPSPTPPPPSPTPPPPSPTPPPPAPSPVTVASVTVSGQVSTADGVPIQNALLEFQGIPLCPDLCTQPQTYTDGDGAYSTELPDGAYTVYAFFVYPSGGMITLEAQQDSIIPGAGDYEVDFILPGENTVDGGIQRSTDRTDGNSSSGSNGETYDWSQDPNSYDYMYDACAGGVVCDPSNGGLPDFVPGGGLTIPGL